MRLNCLNDLARLPYFDLNPTGELVLADASLGPIVDAHTHLALSYGLFMQVDLARDHPRTRHYLPPERPLDLDVYSSRNFTPAGVTRMTRDLTLLSLTPWGLRATHTVPNLARQMAQLGIVRSLLLPIDLPLLPSTAMRYLRLVAGREDLLSCGSVHPYGPNWRGKLDRQRAFGALGVKVHPAVQLIYPDDPRAMRLYAACGERGMFVIFHCGPVGIEPKPGRRRSQVRFYERPVAENPDTTFVLGHSGALQMPEALALAKRYPKVWLELSSQALSKVRKLVEEGPRDRMVFGTDWPFYHQAMSLAKVLLATEGDDDLRRKILYENSARLLNF